MAHSFCSRHLSVSLIGLYSCTLIASRQHVSDLLKATQFKQMSITKGQHFEAGSDNAYQDDHRKSLSSVFSRLLVEEQVNSNLTSRMMQKVAHLASYGRLCLALETTVRWTTKGCKIRMLKCQKRQSQRHFIAKSLFMSIHPGILRGNTNYLLNAPLSCDRPTLHAVEPGEAVISHPIPL